MVINCFPKIICWRDVKPNKEDMSSKDLIQEVTFSVTELLKGVMKFFASTNEIVLKIIGWTEIFISSIFLEGSDDWVTAKVFPKFKSDIVDLPGGQKFRKNFKKL